MSTTFVTLIRNCLEELNENPHPITGTMTAIGTNLQVVDTTNLKDTSTKADTSRHVGKWVRFYDDAATPVENIRKIATDTPSTGILVPESAFSKATAAGWVYEIHEKLHPTRLKQAINDCLAELRYQDILPLTLVADGDMVGTTVATYWDNSNATPAYDTAKVLFGTQSLSVAATAANGYAFPKTSILVTPGETLLVWAPVYGSAKQAELVLYDVTNSAEIETARHDEQGWGLLLFKATVPADCYQVRPHLRTKTNAGTTYWDHVGILKTDQKVYDAPTWLTKDQDFIKVVSFPVGNALTSDNADNAYNLWQYGTRAGNVVDTIPAQRGVVPLRIELQQRPSEPLFGVGRRRYPSLSADTDVTTADPTTVKAGTLALVYRRLGSDYSDRAGYWAKVFSDLRRGDEPPFSVRQKATWVR
jgi:hypothetical protein